MRSATETSGNAEGRASEAGAAIVAGDQLVVVAHHAGRRALHHPGAAAGVEDHLLDEGLVLRLRGPGESDEAGSIAAAAAFRQAVAS